MAYPDWEHVNAVRKDIWGERGGERRNCRAGLRQKITTIGKFSTEGIREDDDNVWKAAKPFKWNKATPCTGVSHLRIPHGSNAANAEEQAKGFQVIYLRLNPTMLR